MRNDDSRFWELFFAAMQRDPEEREAFLDKKCAGDSELKARVMAEIARSEDSQTRDSQTRDSRVRGSQTAIGPGTSVGHYIIVRELGRGGMGIVYLADDIKLKRQVALKALAPELSAQPESRERLKREAQAAAKLSHPGIATVYAVEEIDGELYISAEYVAGETLRTIVGSRGPLPLSQVVAIGVQLADALSAAHTLGVIHRDIKPENIVKTAGDRIKILDFGLAYIEGPSESHLTRTGVVMGTPAYMAPEQATGQPVDFRTDLFAAGLVLYELAAGQNPFAANTMSGTIGRIIQHEAPPLSEAVPASTPELDRIIDTCLRKNRLERHRDTRQLTAELEEVAADLAQRRHDSTNRRSGSGVRTLGPTPMQRWWESHQMIVSAVYVLTIYPAWHVRSWPPQPWGARFLLVVLAAASAGTSLRLHLLFTERQTPGELSALLNRVRPWKKACDLAFALTLMTGAAGIYTEHNAFAMLFIVIAATIVVAAFVIEPSTERAAFPETR